MGQELEAGAIKKWGDTDDVAALPRDKRGRPYLLGHFIQRKPVNSQYGPGFLLEIDTTGPGAERQTWGCPSRLSMTVGRIRESGTLIIIFPLTAKKRMTGGDAYDFKVFTVERGDTAESFEWEEPEGIV